MEGDLCTEQIQTKIVTNSPKTPPNSPKIPKHFTLSLHKTKAKKIQKRALRSTSGSINAAESSSAQLKKNTKLTCKDQQMHRLVFQKGGIPDGTELVYISHRTILLEGYKLGRGIICSCCNASISPSQFEVHAGEGTRKKPYENIYISSNISLHEYALYLKLKGQVSKKNDEICGICKKDGDLLLCAGCPRSFHKECVSGTSSSSITSMEKWFCTHCSNSMKSVVKKENVVGPIDQIAKRSIRIVNQERCDLIACAICRAYDYTKDGFDDMTSIVCDQCEREYHIGCLRADKNINLKELPAGDWFCTPSCEILHSVLETVVACGPVKVPDSLMGGIGIPNSVGITDSEVKWIVVRGKVAFYEDRELLGQAVDIFHQRFDPIIDFLTKKDFIPSMAYGLIMGDSDFFGVHTAMLTIDSRVVTAGMFRVFGEEIAELPLVATSETYQGKGYFQLFFKCFEKLVKYLKIKKIVVPAAEDVKPMWTRKFGFEKVAPIQLSEYRQTLTSMVAFQGTTLLEKEVGRGRGTYEDGVGFSLSMG